MNMYRCKTEVDFCLHGNSGKEKEDIVNEKPKVVTNDLKGKDSKKHVTRPRRPKTHLPITRGAALLVR